MLLPRNVAIYRGSRFLTWLHEQQMYAICWRFTCI